MLGDVQNLLRGKKKTREKARQEIRKFVNPYSTFTRGRVKYGFKKSHPLTTNNFMFVLREKIFRLWCAETVHPTKKRKRKPRVRIKRKTFTGKCDQGRIGPHPTGYTCKHFVC